MKAYDISLGDWQPGAPATGGQGWCFGLPPGLTTGQWPLDPLSGLPMMHGFTLLLPEDYRIHGPDLVAVSFFATAPEHSDGGPEESPAGMPQAVTGEAPPKDADLRPFWNRAQETHPRLSRMTDGLGCAYATILLTQEEFDGAPCPMPPLVESALAGMVPPARWMTMGSAAAYQAFACRPAPCLGAPEPLHIHRPLRWTPRAIDPNAGKRPREYFGEEPPVGAYQPHYYWLDGVVEVENWREYDWAKGHGERHIGGTMRPVQGMPSFSPYYVEFDEECGGYNFGGGLAQLDFKEMQFEWACG